MSLRLGTLGRMKNAEKVKTVMKIDLDDIMPDPSQPRKEFDDDKIAEMSANLIKRGQLAPILVRENPDGTPPFMVFDGEYRWRSAKLKGQPAQLEAVVYDGDVNPDEILEGQFLINELRTDMSFTDRASFFKGRVDRYGSVEAVAERMEMNPRRIWRVLQAANATGLAGEARDEGLSKDAETLNAIEALERQDPGAAAALVKTGKEKGRITRNDVTEASRSAKAKSPEKGEGAAEPKKPTATATAAKGRPAPAPEPAAEPVDPRVNLRVVVRWESGAAKKDAEFAKRWKALESRFGGPAFLIMDRQPETGFVYVAFGSHNNYSEFPLHGLRIDRITDGE